MRRNGSLHRASGGNPFLLEHLVRERDVQGGPRPGRSDRFPDTCRDAVRRRLALLSSDCVQLLRRAAVVGPTPTLTSLHAASDVGVEAVLDLLAEAAGAGLVVEEEDLKRYS